MNNEFPKIDYPFRDRLDWLLFIATLATGAVFAWYVYVNNLLLVMVDQYSHLAIARQLTDSMTPGISQLGFWPPLVHILMAPSAAIDVLYHTGLAAAVVLVPVLAVSVVFLHRLVVMLTGRELLGVMASAVYVFNPYMLYYSVTPMSDMLFVALLTIATYFFIHWWLTQSMSSLMWAGFIASLSAMARFEGFFLIAFIGLGLLIRLVMLRRSYHQIEAAAILYGLLASLGIVFIVIYGFIFAGDPMAFMNNEWGAYSQQRSFFLPTEHNIVESMRYLTLASKQMMGGLLVVLAMVSLSALWLTLRRGRTLFAVLLLILGSPFIFDLFALFQGSAIIYLPELPPHDPRFFNERYGLNWFAFAVIVPTLLASLLYEKIRMIRWYYEPLAVGSAGLIMALAFYGSYSTFSDVVCVTCFETVRGSMQTSPTDHAHIARILREEYDGGRILMTRALHNEVAVKAEIPLEKYVLEANEHYFEQALAYPWLFTDWVVMQNVNFDDKQSAWSQEAELVSKNWGNDQTFLRFYEEVYSGHASVLYRLKRSETLTYTSGYGIPEAIVPSLTESAPWDVEETFFTLQTMIETESPDERGLVSNL